MGRKSGSLISFASVFVEIFSALLFTPFLIKNLGQSEYGVYTLTISITSYLSLLDLGVGNSVVKYMAKFHANGHKDDEERFIGTISIYYLIITAIIIIVGIVIYLIFPGTFSNGLTISEVELARKLLIVTVINMSVTIGTSYFFYAVVAYENFVVSKGTTLVFSILRIFASIIALMCGAKSFGIATINMITTCLIRLVMIWYVLFKMKIKPKFDGMQKDLIHEIVSFSFIVLLQMIATQLNNMADQILIGIIVPASSVILAIYGLGAQINQYFQTFGGVLNGVLMPGVVRMVEQGASKDDLSNEMARIGRFNFAFIGLIWAIFLVFGKQFIVLWSGEAYSQSFFVALLLISPQMIMQTQLIGSQILWAMNKHRTQAILKFVIVIINFFLTVELIKWNPLKGATIGTFISLMLGDVIVMQIVFKKEIGISLTSYYKKLLSGILQSLALAIFVGYIVSFANFKGWVGFTFNCASMIIVFFTCMYIFGASEYEKRYIHQIVVKLVRRITK